MENRQGRLDNRPNVLQIDSKKDASGAGQTPESIAGGNASATAEPGLRPEIIERVEEQEKDEMRSFVKIADDLWAMLGMDSSFKRFKDNIMIESMEDGLVIQLVEQVNAPLLEDGGLQFKPTIKKALNLLGANLGKYPNKLEIDGHAIDMSHLSGSTKKWVGSSMLADLARGELESAGLKPGQITKVAGCADSRPLNPRSSTDPLNRRVSILVRPRQWRPERY
jgi:chemotaxis protein MotB